MFHGACDLCIRQQATGGYRQKVITKKLWANIINCGRQEYKGIGNLIIAKGTKKSFMENNERTVCFSQREKELGNFANMQIKLAAWGQNI